MSVHHGRNERWEGCNMKELSLRTVLFLEYILSVIRVRTTIDQCDEAIDSYSFTCSGELCARACMCVRARARVCVCVCAIQYGCVLLYCMAQLVWRRTSLRCSDPFVERLPSLPSFDGMLSYFIWPAHISDKASARWRVVVNSVESVCFCRHAPVQ